ncbi:hypothetical protein B0G75_105155 [Paraburkholderia sp. BL18I3N2]|nr:hypothetical protein B0G75_105155 [Paraburkholderia sp. BL18I3N2]
MTCGENDSGNKNGVPRTQSMTEFRGRRCPDLSCSEYFVLHSRRIHVDPMARLNAKPMPVVRNARDEAVARGSAANRTRVRRSGHTTRFDAAGHMDGATQHPARARCALTNGAWRGCRRRYSRGVARPAARLANGWRSPCVSSGEFTAATRPPRHAAHTRGGETQRCVSPRLKRSAQSSTPGSKWTTASPRDHHERTPFFIGRRRDSDHRPIQKRRTP